MDREPSSQSKANSLNDTSNYNDLKIARRTDLKVILLNQFVEVDGHEFKSNAEMVSENEVLFQVHDIVRVI